MESTILLVEPDPPSQRVMEVSLRKVGFSVHVAMNQSEALAQASEYQPQMILCDAQLPDGTGYDLCQKIRGIETLSGCGIIIMSEDTSPQARIDAITAGADEFMRKPVRIKEIVNRTTALLDRQAYDTLTELDSSRNFSGTLEDIGLVDLLQLVDSGKKTCIVHLASDPDQSGGFAEPNESGRIYCRDGHMIDAELNQLNGADAVYRMMLWDNGVFEIEFTPLGRDDAIQLNTPSLVMEGMRRVDQWTKIREQLPSLNTRLDVDYSSLSTKVDELPEEVQGLLRLFDGHRSIREVINEADLLDLSALEAIGRLFVDKVIFDKRTRPSSTLGRPSSVSLNAWLSSAPPPRRGSSTSRPATAIPGLPSVLGRAMIPAVDTPSQILRPMSVDTAYPQPLEDEPILLTDSARKRPPSVELHAPGNAEPGILQVPRPRTITAPPAIYEQFVEAPPPPPPRSLTPLGMAPAEVQTVEEPAPKLPPSNEFASGRQVSPSPAVISQTIEKLAIENTNPNTEPSAAHLREDTAERFFRMYDEDRVAEAAGVSSRGTQIALAAAAGLVIILMVVLFTQKEEEIAAKPQAAWPTVGGEIKIEAKPLPQATPTANQAAVSPSAAPDAPVAAEAPAKEGAGTTAAAPAISKVEGNTPAPKEAAAPPANSSNPIPTAKTSPAPVASQAPVAKPEPKPKPEPVVTKAKPAAKPAASETKPKVIAKKPLPRKPKKAKNDPEVLDRLTQAEQALEQKDLNAAAAGFKKVISLNKSNADALSGLALTLVSQGQAKSAIKYARRALKYTKYRSARGYLALGLAYGEQERDKKAIKALKRFLKLAPNDARAGEIESFIESLEEEE